MKRKRYRPSLSRNGPKLPSWLSSRTSFNSEMSVPASQAGSISALDRLNAAARRVDKMLMELAVVDGFNANQPECARFPTSNGTNGVHQPSKLSSRDVQSSSKREMSSTCHTEYDNADSDGVYSDSEMINDSQLEQTKERLDDLKQSLIASKSSKENQQFRSSPHPHKGHHLSANRAGIEGSALSQITNNRRFDNGSEADIDSNCSSLASSMMFDKLRWKSVHSIGYENEYEFASEDEEEVDIHSSAATELSGILGGREQGAFVPSSSQPAFEPMDADTAEQDLEIGEATSFRPYTNAGRGDILDARGSHQT
uniref:Uncharacterized protein n=1 Tax=Ditylenchus dipsaci TaxID=166011 RepID=A0A915CPD7_9BILA